jgi:hypothetical protein
MWRWQKIGESPQQRQNLFSRGDGAACDGAACDGFPPSPPPLRTASGSPTGRRGSRSPAPHPDATDSTDKTARNNRPLLLSSVESVASVESVFFWMDGDGIVALTVVANSAATFRQQELVFLRTVSTLSYKATLDRSATAKSTANWRWTWRWIWRSASRFIIF